MQMIKDLDGIIVSANKTDNIFVMEKEDYLKQQQENITKDYKKDKDSTLDSINGEAALIANRLELDDRIEAMAKKHA